MKKREGIKQGNIKDNRKYVNDIDIDIIFLLSLVIAMSLNNHFVFIYLSNNGQKKKRTLFFHQGLLSN